MPPTLRCNPKLFEKDLTGQVIIVTGANSGCGLETSRQLCKQNATVILACRNKAKAQAALEEIDSKNASFLQLDLSDLGSVRAFVKEFSETHDRLDVLVNNAGIMACPYGTTKDGFEMQFGCNHLGHFLLTKLLLPLLTKTSKEITNQPSRLVNLSSCIAASVNMMGQVTGHPEIYFDDLNWQSEGKEYDKIKAYSQSKLANYLHALEASQMYDSSSLLAVSVHPGWVRSNLDQHVLPSNFLGNFIRNAFQWSGSMISAVDGAQTTLHCVLSDAGDLENGAFYSQVGIYEDKSLVPGGWPIKLGNPNATPEAAAKLWEESEKLVETV